MAQYIDGHATVYGRSSTSRTIAKRFATFSPDGKCIAYAAHTGGHEDVFVRPYPAGNPAVQISGTGGTAPAWSRDGRGLYYMTTATPRALLRVPIASAAGALTAGPPTTVQARWPYEFYTTSRGYDVLRDGSLLGVQERTRAGSRQVNRVTELYVVLNFVQELRARVK